MMRRLYLPLTHPSQPLRSPSTLRKAATSSATMVAPAARRRCTAISCVTLLLDTRYSFSGKSPEWRFELRPSRCAATKRQMRGMMATYRYLAALKPNYAMKGHAHIGTGDFVGSATSLSRRYFSYSWLMQPSARALPRRRSLPIVVETIGDARETPLQICPAFADAMHRERELQGLGDAITARTAACSPD